MKIAPDRYKNEFLFSLKDLRNGGQIIVREFKTNPIANATYEFREHLVKENETLQSLATRYYDLPELWCYIYYANVDILEFPDIDTVVGKYIKIPLRDFIYRNFVGN